MPLILFFNPNLVDQSPNKVLKKDIKDYGPDSCSSEDEDTVDQIQVIKKETKKQRNSVSAEAYGMFNKRENFKPIVIAKSQDTKNKIYKRINEAFMFNCLDLKEREIIVNAMEEKRFKAGDQVIKQGEEGNYLYVIDEGQLDCFKKYQNQPEPTYLKTYQPGESFGELALLYNAPRAASIVSKTPSVLFALDRETFNHIVKDAAMKKRQKYEDFLTKLPVLQSIADPYEKTKIADSIEQKSYKQGEVIVNQGATQGDIHFVESGEVLAMKNGQQVFKYVQGDYFGEIPLLLSRNQPFQFISNSNNTSLLIVGEGNYKNTLVIVEKQLKANLQKYNGQI
ncbi:hypothetical protein ABPG74_018250 [Tetrahymena malaccensis]